MNEITRESLTAELFEAVEAAKKAGDIGAVVQGLEAIAKLHGLIVERRIVEHAHSPEDAQKAFKRAMGQAARKRPRLTVVE